MKRVLVSVTLLALSSLVVAPAVLAAAPGNDLYANRVAVGSLPYSTTSDTTEAGTDADDTEASTNCTAPVVSHSVWYEYTPTADGALIIDGEASNYTVGFYILTGSPGSFSLVDCFAFSGLVFVEAGVTYTIDAFDFSDGTGGLLDLTLSAPPPPPTVALTINPNAKFNANGSATVSGKVTCTGVADYGEVDVSLTQIVGRTKIRGWGWTNFDCDGATHTWTVAVIGENGLFKGGKATADVDAYACGFFCADSYGSQTVNLKK